LFDTEHVPHIMNLSCTMEDCRVGRRESDEDVSEVARSQSLHGGEPQTSRRPQWRIEGWAESQT
jgi:hypothetical protein